MIENRIFAAVIKNIPTLVLLALLACACQQQPLQHFSGTAFGTLYNVTYIGDDAPTLRQQVDSLLVDLNSTFSIFDTNSLISKLNVGETVALNDDFIQVFKTAQMVSRNTGGAFDCTIQPLVELWGFGRKNQRHTISQEEIDSVKQFVGSHLIHLQNRNLVKSDARVQLNFNAIAKGYAVDRVADFLQSKGFQNCIVEIGGEVVARGTHNGKSWRVGIQIPTERADGAIESRQSFPLQNQGVATSGNYRNYFEEDGIRYTHILNPVTGKPERSNLLSVTVIADDCCTADAYATAFMVLGIDQTKSITKKKHLKTHLIYTENGKFRYETITP